MARGEFLRHSPGRCLLCFDCIEHTIREILAMLTLMKRLQIGFLGMLVFGLCVADDLPYKVGTVTQVSSIRTKEGHFLDYWTFLSTSWRQEMEEGRKRGIVVSYAFFQATPKAPHEPDLYLVVECPNMAAFDSIDEKMT